MVTVRGKGVLKKVATSMHAVVGGDGLPSSWGLQQESKE